MDLFLEAHADEIARAAGSFFGHVTHGSLEALMQVIERVTMGRVLEALRAAQLRARGREPGVTDRFKKWGTSQHYWKGRSDAGTAIRALAKEYEDGTKGTANLRKQE